MRYDLLRQRSLLMAIVAAVACTPKTIPTQDSAPSILRAKVDRAFAIRSLAITDAIPDGELGSPSRPVEVGGPLGEQQYLARLACADGSLVEFERLGSNPGVADQHMRDDYIVHCRSDGTTRLISMDMYHGGPPPQEAINGYELLAELPARAARGCPPAVHPDADSSAAYAFGILEVETPPRLLSPPPSDSGLGLFVTFVVNTDGRVDLDTFETLADDPESIAALRAWLETLEWAPAQHHEGCPVRFRVEAEVPVP